jgi:shikimate kinase
VGVIDEYSNIYLVGPMGVGKTTVGRLLAKELKMRFIDTDHEVERRAGADINWIFDVEGETGFRTRESRVLEDVSSGSDQVVSTGGGIILSSTNRDKINKGYCVYLCADSSQLMSRIGNDKKRPLLQTNDPKSLLENIIKFRDPLYREVAQLVIQASSGPPRQLAKEIVKSLKLSRDAKCNQRSLL